MPLAPCDGAFFTSQQDVYLNFLRRLPAAFEFLNLALDVVQPVETGAFQFGHRVGTDTEHVARIIEIVGIAVGNQAAHLKVVFCISIYIC